MLVHYPLNQLLQKYTRTKYSISKAREMTKPTGALSVKPYLMRGVEFLVASQSVSIPGEKEASFDTVLRLRFGKPASLSFVNSFKTLPLSPLLPSVPPLLCTFGA